MHIASIGIDLGKTTFHLVALDDHSNIVIRKKFSRGIYAYYWGCTHRHLPARASIAYSRMAGEMSVVFRRKSSITRSTCSL